MDFSHIPVLFEESIQGLDIKSGATYIDGTLGGAGHSSEILKRLDEKGCLIGIDQDVNAIKASEKRLEELNSKAKIILVNDNFKNIKKICRENGISKADGIILDLGVSSHQLDEAERGFSYQKDAPLDMRMDRGQQLTAEQIVNGYEEDSLRSIIRGFGEEKWAARIALFIVKERTKGRIETTGQLVDIIKAAIPSSARRDGPHPAKRTFQAIRIAVNDELGILKGTIEDGMSILAKNGRFCIITFHSLEDRIVKNEFQRLVNPCTCPADFPVCACGKIPVAEHVTRKPVTASQSELDENPRARSAKLRVLKKL